MAKVVERYICNECDKIIDEGMIVMGNIITINYNDEKVVNGKASINNKDAETLVNAASEPKAYHTRCLYRVTKIVEQKTPRSPAPISDQVMF